MYNAANLLVPMAAGDEFEAPGISEFLGLPALFFEGTPFEINRIILVRILAVAVMLLLFWLALRKPSRVPGRGQSIAELALGFVQVQIADQILGKEMGRRYLPLLAGMFFGILAMNVTGVIPALNISGTALIGMPLLLGLVAYVVFIHAGIKRFGTAKFFKNSLFPAGVPWPIYILLAPIEFINIFIVRPISLALRLLLNMMVGHLLLVLCFGATSFFIFTAGGWLGFFGIGTLAFGFIFTFVEFAVFILQAYIFTLLTAVYVQQAVAEEH